MVINNLPSEKKGYYTMEQVECDLCGRKHPEKTYCEFEIQGKNLNAPEARDLTLGDINEIMKHKRAIIIGVVLKQESIAKLQPLVTKAKSLAVSKAEVLTLDNCFQAFVREGHLSGSD